MSFKKILVPTDFSRGSAHALRLGCRLAVEQGAELVVAYSWYIPPSAFTLEHPISTEILQNVVDEAQQRLDETVRTARGSGAKPVSGQLLDGAPWSEIVQLLDRQSFDLCVIGTHGRTGLKRVLLGSVAEKVIRHAPCSVLAVHEGGEGKSFSNVLVPTDFSKSAESALDLAAKIVRPEGTLTLFHVVEIPVRYSHDAPVPGFEIELDRSAAMALERHAADLARKTTARVVTYSQIGTPGAATLAALERDPTIDLVVMGSHGRTGIKRALLGSVAEKVVRHAHCPVLVARKN